jgi:hypothetical protein
MVVSIANPASPTTALDVTASEQIYDFTRTPEHSSSAWRNTQTHSILAGASFKFLLDPSALLEILHPEYEISFDVETQRVPVDWSANKVAQQILATMRAAGARSARPLYLLPEIRASLPKADLAIELKPDAAAVAGLRFDKAQPIQPFAALGFKMTAPAKAPAPLVVSGVVPKDAVPGEVFIVRVTAHYPERAVQFTQFLRVTR